MSVCTCSSAFVFGDPAPVLGRGSGDSLLLLGETAALQLTTHFGGDVISIDIVQVGILKRRTLLGFIVGLGVADKGLLQLRLIFS
jgi:hypothetical protein